MIFFAKTHTGNVRHANEDCLYIPEDKGGCFALVADGMGGHSAGEVASRIFVETARETLDALCSQIIIEQNIRDAFTLANSRIWQQAHTDTQMRGMGTTATLAVFQGSDVLIGNVGDSRAYVCSGGALRQITKDHSYVQLLVDKGLISQKDAASHPQRNIITRAIGTEKAIDTDIFALALEQGDVLLLCTDGLSGAVPEAVIAEILGGRPEDMADKLIDAALAAGGPDNISVVIAVFDGGAA